ncbi:uncharacterized protein EDB91DRAFT_203437 [Suillus paluster]|uniref:uncharacterized protein n=1 Tax=Suillus paluster TaxID=48578 RepID=UPI001B862CF1|nr:uncharacterized protein EDB91DRAFT_203437 [Suillus paluster]KAG1722641.1 hypothetical protein EDB91DRAFT_203437 [Suillus paluster]
MVLRVSCLHEVFVLLSILPQLSRPLWLTSRLRISSTYVCYTSIVLLSHPPRIDTSETVAHVNTFPAQPEGSDSEAIRSFALTIGYYHFLLLLDRVASACQRISRQIFHPACRSWGLPRSSTFSSHFSRENPYFGLH